MKPIESSKLKTISGVLYIGLGVSLCTTVVWIVLLLISLIKGTPVPSSEGLLVNVFMTNSNHFVNQMKDIYVSNINGQLVFFKPSIWINLFPGLYTIIEWGSISYVIYLMLKIINSIIKGNPFDKLNANRLRIIAILFITVPVILQIASNIVVSNLITSINIENVKLSAQPFTGELYISVFVGILLIALSETLRIGTWIKEENEFTI